MILLIRTFIFCYLYLILTYSVFSKRIIQDLITIPGFPTIYYLIITVFIFGGSIFYFRSRLRDITYKKLFALSEIIVLCAILLPFLNLSFISFFMASYPQNICSFCSILAHYYFSFNHSFFIYNFLQAVSKCKKNTGFFSKKKSVYFIYFYSHFRFITVFYLYK